MTEENKSVKNFPNLRFPEFEGDWEVKKLGDVSSISSGGTPNRTNPSYWNGRIPWVTTSLIDFNLIETTDEYITDEGLKNSSAKLFPKETLLMAMYGQGKTRGKIGMLNIEASTNQACGAIITDKSVLNPFFAFQNLAKRYDEIRDLSNQGGQENLSGGIIKGIDIIFPNLPEQDKIASFFLLVDERIQTQKKIIEGLITQKSFIIKKLFIQNLSGLNTVFLSDFLKIPNKIKPDFIDKEKLLTVKLHLKGIHKNENSDSLSLGATNYFIRKKGQFIYGKQNLFNGAFAIIPDKFDGFLSSADVPALDINENIVNAKYLFYFFSRESFYKKLEDIASGSGSKRIHENTLLNLKITIPSLAIQNKVASFLSKLDEKINLENELLTQYENQKKYLLQNLFV